MCFSSDEVEQSHPLKAYTRHIDKFHAVFRFSKEEADDLIRKFQQENPDFNDQDLLWYKTRTCWPLDCQMQAN